MRAAGTLERLAMGVLLCAGAACAPGNEPRWIHLAEGFRPEPLATGRSFAQADGRPVELVLHDGEPWLRTDLPPATWSFRPEHDDWSTPLPIRGRGRPRDGSLQHRLWAGEVSYESRALGKFRRDPDRSAGTYLMKPNRVSLFLGEEGELPSDLRLELYAGLGREVDGHWEVRGRRFSGQAIALWPGQRVQRTLDIPSRSALRFATCLEPALPTGRGEARSVTFRVIFNGVTLLEHVQPDHDAGSFQWHELDLPPTRDAELVFEVEGPLSYAAFLCPVIGPRAVGSYSARPWGAARPDIVVFQADTFRADNLAAFGGPGGLAPHLDALAAESRAFPHTWSVGTYTLPAHTSMFTGLYPRQAGILGMESSVPDELVSVAEVLSAAGYRTGAVTDAVFVSQRFGLAQGFQWFEERLGTVESTLERAASFLDADDGRPVFLFVQTYRTHTPYRVSAETRAQHGARLGIEGDFEDLRAELDRLDARPALDPPAAARRAELVRRIEAHYRGCVLDLDRAFVDFHRDLEQRGLLESGALVFTSDHGEAFGEHDNLYHGGRVWEEVTRVPLFLHGAGIEPARIDSPASLIDLPRTLTALGGVAPHPDWLGTSLLGEVPQREVFVFQCKDDTPVSTWGLVADGKKLMGVEDRAALVPQELLGAYDLRRDPAETQDLRAQEGWPAELLERLGGRLDVLFVPLVGTEAVQLDAAQLRELGAMGYGGEG